MSYKDYSLPLPSEMQFYEASIWDIPENRVHIGQEDEYQLGFVKTTWDEEDQREALNENSFSSSSSPIEDDLPLTPLINHSSTFRANTPICSTSFIRSTPSPTSIVKLPLPVLAETFTIRTGLEPLLVDSWTNSQSSLIDKDLHFQPEYIPPDMPYPTLTKGSRSSSAMMSFSQTSAVPSLVFDIGETSFSSRAPSTPPPSNYFEGRFFEEYPTKIFAPLRPTLLPSPKHRQKRTRSERELDQELDSFVHHDADMTEREETLGVNVEAEDLDPSPPPASRKRACRSKTPSYSLTKFSSARQSAPAIPNARVEYAIQYGGKGKEKEKDQRSGSLGFSPERVVQARMQVERSTPALPKSTMQMAYDHREQGEDERSRHFGPSPGRVLQGRIQAETTDPLDVLASAATMRLGSEGTDIGIGRARLQISDLLFGDQDISPRVTGTVEKSWMSDPIGSSPLRLTQRIIDTTTYHQLSTPSHPDLWLPDDNDGEHQQLHPPIIQSDDNEDRHNSFALPGVIPSSKIPGAKYLVSPAKTLSSAETTESEATPTIDSRTKRAREREERRRQKVVAADGDGSDEEEFTPGPRSRSRTGLQLKQRFINGEVADLSGTPLEDIDLARGLLSFGSRPRLSDGLADESGRASQTPTSQRPLVKRSSFIAPIQLKRDTPSLGNTIESITARGTRGGSKNKKDADVKEEEASFQQPGNSSAVSTVTLPSSIGRKGIPAQFAHLPVKFTSISEHAKIRRAKMAASKITTPPAGASSSFTKTISPAKSLPNVKAKPKIAVKPKRSVTSPTDLPVLRKGTKSRPAPPSPPPPTPPPQTLIATREGSKRKRKVVEVDSDGEEDGDGTVGKGGEGEHKRVYAEGELLIMLDAWDGLKPITKPLLRECRQNLINAGYSERTVEAIKWYMKNTLWPRFSEKYGLPEIRDLRNWRTASDQSNK